MSLAMTPPSQLSKPQRVLACVLCQQRKVKCDRKFPCSNCLKIRAKCIPATQTARRRRRRFPERELLQRLRLYEDLLRQNSVKFEPLHNGSTVEGNSSGVGDAGDWGDEHPQMAGADSSPSTERSHENRDVWRAMIKGCLDSDNNNDSSDNDMPEVIGNFWVESFGKNDNLLFGLHETAVDISTLHPEPVQIFRLWQVYLDNVNPLLKVTHTPSLQGRIIEAVSNIANVEPTMEALMFSIYCMSLVSVATDDCQAMFGSSKRDLLRRYRFGCQQALLNCGFLRSSDRDCLTALYLYLVSVRPDTVPKSLSSMLGVAVRIAERIGIHNESVLAKFTALEAEMCRRLWWSLVLFDTRIAELAVYKTSTLAPTWDCNIPLNVNDSDFRQEMKDPPPVQAKCTEALFAVVRGEVGDFVRHAKFHLDINHPTLRPIIENAQHDCDPNDNELISLEKRIEDKYFRFCDPANPLHFMTMWMTRAYIAKYRLMEHYSRYSSSSVHQTEIQRDAAMSYALGILTCDTKILTSSLTKGYTWLLQLYFPFPAYVLIAHNTRRQPLGPLAERSWEVMSDSYEARFGLVTKEGFAAFKLFSQIILNAWKVREEALRQAGESIVAPRIVLALRYELAQIAQDADRQLKGATNSSANHLPMTGPSTRNVVRGANCGTAEQVSFTATNSAVYSDMPGLNPLNFYVNQAEWASMEWNLANAITGDGIESLDLSLPW